LQCLLHSCNGLCNHFAVPDPHPSNKLTPAALQELTTVSQSDWQVVALPELLDRINRVAAVMTAGDGDAVSSAGRVKPTFTERSFRHYQTLGCIDAPAKLGRLAHYGFRHFIQALLVRRLLAERVTSEQIVTLLVGRDTEELERMLRGGVEITARPGDDGDHAAFAGKVEELIETWNRVRLAPGVELHISSKFPVLDEEERRRMFATFMKWLGRQGA
jgi:hypothetical protein